ncbi:MAG: hypothetical protein KME50_10955 [Nostoc desertorum CM1-VF14]|nr:hypothetical protein [Nostoc desertorum CM1-VF14]
MNIISVIEENFPAIGCYESESNKAFMLLKSILVISRFWARDLGQKHGFYEDFENSRQCMDARFFTAIANNRQAIKNS